MVCRKILLFMMKRVKHSNRQQRYILAMSFVALATILTSMITSPLRISNARTVALQAYHWRNVVTGGSGGFMPDIIFNQKQKDLIYAPTDMGGAYRWNSKTSTWTQLLNWVSPDQWNMTGVESLATDPVDPNRLYIAAGTYTKLVDKHEWRYPALN